jgi:hypothetical protein
MTSNKSNTKGAVLSALVVTGILGGTVVSYSPKEVYEVQGIYRGCTVDATGESAIKINDKWYATTLDRLDTLQVDNKYSFTVKKPRFLFPDRVTEVRSVENK